MGALGLYWLPSGFLFLLPSGFYLAYSAIVYQTFGQTTFVYLVQEPPLWLPRYYCTTIIYVSKTNIVTETTQRQGRTHLAPQVFFDLFGMNQAA